MSVRPQTVEALREVALFLGKYEESGVVMEPEAVRQFRQLIDLAADSLTGPAPAEAASNVVFFPVVARPAPQGGAA
jgi:hypothetical protein